MKKIILLSAMIAACILKMSGNAMAQYSTSVSITSLTPVTSTVCDGIFPVSATVINNDAVNPTNGTVQIKYYLDGVLVLPCNKNTQTTCEEIETFSPDITFSCIDDSYPRKWRVNFENKDHDVLAIIHTHPEVPIYIPYIFGNSIGIDHYTAGVMDKTDYGDMGHLRKWEIPFLCIGGVNRGMSAAVGKRDYLPVGWISKFFPYNSGQGRYIALLKGDFSLISWFSEHQYPIK
jgi:hypothetical protein